MTFVSILFSVLVFPITFSLFLANAIILLCFFLFLLAVFSNFCTIPVVRENNTVKEDPAIPTRIPTIVAWDTRLNVPNDADNVIKILSA